MNNDTKNILQGLGHYELLVLYYLSQTENIVNQRTISKDTGVSPTTLRQKLDTLIELELISIIPRGRNNQVVITAKGQDNLANWEKTTVGKRIIKQLKDILEKNK
ncbi:MAG: hypothetical protein ACFE9L_00160 [Candidatus Hodarchaeota archaeon]